MERLFLGLSLDDDVRAALGRYLERTAPDGLPGRPVSPADWHLTLRFLWLTDEPTRDGVERAMSEAVLGPRFPLRLAGLGAFPHPTRASVLWIGVEEPTDALTSLATIAERIARQAGFTAETRPFRPHVTLSRLRKPLDVAPLLQWMPPAGIHLTIRAVTLFRTRSGDGPSRYQPLAEWPFHADEE